MRFLLLNSENISQLKTGTGACTNEEITKHKKRCDLALRIGLYGFPVVVAIWIWLSWPNILPKKVENFYLYFGGLLFLSTATAIVHELIHLLALPKIILLPDTIFVINLQTLWGANLAIQPGGRVTREQYIWMSLLPFLIITCIPFALQATGHALSLPIGLAACCNFYLSSIDISNAVIIFIETKYGQILKEGK